MWRFIQKLACGKITLYYRYFASFCWLFLGVYICTYNAWGFIIWAGVFRTFLLLKMSSKPPAIAIWTFAFEKGLFTEQSDLKKIFWKNKIVKNAMRLFYTLLWTEVWIERKKFTTKSISFADVKIVRFV